MQSFQQPDYLIMRFYLLKRYKQNLIFNQNWQYCVIPLESLPAHPIAAKDRLSVAPLPGKGGFAQPVHDSSADPAFLDRFSHNDFNLLVVFK